MLTEKEIMTGAMIFTMLDSIDKSEPAGKRSRKYISRAIKKELAIFVDRSNRKRRYLFLIKSSYPLIHEARDKTGVVDLRVDPGTMISTLMERWPEMMQGFNLDMGRVEELKAAYADSRLQFLSVKYANKMREAVVGFLEGEKENE